MISTKINKYIALKESDIKKEWPPTTTSLNKEKTMAAGAKPNVISSASESNSFPNGPETLSRRANIPSKKSNTAPIIIKVIASS